MNENLNWPTVIIAISIEIGPILLMTFPTASVIKKLAMGLVPPVIGLVTAILVSRQRRISATAEKARPILIFTLVVVFVLLAELFTYWYTLIFHERVLRANVAGIALTIVAIAVGYIIVRIVSRWPLALPLPVSPLRDTTVVLDQLRQVLRLQHQVDMLLPEFFACVSVYHEPSPLGGYEWRTSEPGKTKRKQLAEAFRGWKLEAERVIRNFRADQVENFWQIANQVETCIALNRPVSQGRDGVLSEASDAWQQLSLLITDIGKEQTKHIPAEIPYDFIDHFYDPTSERHADRAAHIRLLPKGEPAYTQMPAIFEHPPTEGDAVLTYHLRGIKGTSKQLGIELHIGIIDKVYDEITEALVDTSNFSSVRSNRIKFMVRVNEENILEQELYEHGWFRRKKGPIPLRDDQLVIQFRTNAMGETRWNWAAWGEPKLVEWNE